MNLYKKWVLLFVFSGLACVVQAGMTYISGTAPGHKGETIRIIKYADFLSQVEKTLDKGNIDTSGHFALKVELKDTIYAFIVIGFQRQEFYLEPGKSYTIDIPVSPEDEKDKFLNPYLMNRNLNIELINGPENDLNQKLSDFNDLYDNFIATRMVSPFNPKSMLFLDTLNLVISKKFPEPGQGYFGQFIRYRIAGLEGMCKKHSDKVLARMYILNQAVLYNQVEYMEFFNQYFSDYFTTKSTKLSERDLNITINKYASYEALSDSAGKDTLLRNEVIRELVIMKTLMEIYPLKEYNKSNIILILNYISRHSHSTPNKEIASNLVWKLQRFQAGTEAPEFMLPDSHKETFDLHSANGKWVYLNFFTSWCRACIQEYSIIKKLSAKYGDRVEFISIDCDIDYLNFYHFMLGNKDFNWRFLYFQKDFELLENYDIKTYPSYVLIDPEGKIMECPSILPSQGIEKVLDKLTGKN